MDDLGPIEFKSVQDPNTKDVGVTASLLFSSHGTISREVDLKSARGAIEAYLEANIAEGPVKWLTKYAPQWLEHEYARVRMETIHELKGHWGW
jgi:hypothetical protein